MFAACRESTETVYKQDSLAEGLRAVEEVPRDAGADTVAAMLALADAHDLRRRAEASCRQWLCLSAEEGDLGRLSLADIQVVFERCALVFDHGIRSDPFVETRLGLFVSDPTGLYFRGLRPVGHYRLITLLDGTADDDDFVLDEQRHAEPGTALGRCRKAGPGR
jgi:hypothetical protein